MNNDLDDIRRRRDAEARNDLARMAAHYEARGVILSALRKGIRPDGGRNGAAMIRALIEFAGRFGDDALVADGVRITTRSDGSVDVDSASDWEGRWE
jgi:hypothetical protein